MPTDDHDAAAREGLTATWIELAIRLAVLGLLLYLVLHSHSSVHHDRDLEHRARGRALSHCTSASFASLGGRRRLAAVLLTLLSLLILIGPVAWLVLGLIDSIRGLTEQLDLSTLVVPVAARDGEELAARRGNDLSVLATRLDQSAGGVGQDRAAVEISRLDIAPDRGRSRNGNAQVPGRHRRCGVSVSAGAGSGRCRQQAFAQARARTAGRVLWTSRWQRPVRWPAA